MTIKEALWKKGYSIIDLFEKCAAKTDPEIEYMTVSKNCRVPREQVDHEVLPLLLECLNEMGVEWDG